MHKFKLPVMDSRLPEGQFILSACLGRQSKGGNDEDLEIVNFLPALWLATTRWKQPEAP